MIPALDLNTIYDAPVAYHDQGFDTQVLDVFGITDAPAPDLSRWQQVVDRVANPEGEVRIAVVGKYIAVKDSYKSLSEALTHGGLANNVRVKMEWIDSEIFERDDAAVYLEGRQRHPGARRLRRARHRGQDRRGASSPASARCRFSASATGCTWR